MLCFVVGSGGEDAYRAGTETSSVQICGVSGFDLAKLLSKIIVCFTIPGATFYVPVGYERVLESPRTFRERPREVQEGALGVLCESVKFMQFVTLSKSIRNMCESWQDLICNGTIAIEN